MAGDKSIDISDILEKYIGKKKMNDFYTDVSKKIDKIYGPEYDEIRINVEAFQSWKK